MTRLPARGPWAARYHPFAPGPVRLSAPPGPRRHPLRTVLPMYETTGAPAGAPTTGRDPGAAYAVAAVTAVGLSVTSLWWALPGTVAAFLAGHRSGRTRPMVVAVSGLLLVAAVAIPAAPQLLARASDFVAVLVGAALLPWFAGRIRRQYQELVRAGWARAGQLEREQQLVAEQARLRERARIAQDMHDALGHDLSLIALSAGALKLAPGLAEQHRAAAEDVRVRAEAAVDRLGEVIGILREGAGADGAPTGPADFDIARLVDGAAASGLDVVLRLTGERHEVPGVVERAAHRVVQEALTNVVKHAPGASAVVRVAHTATETVVTVENTRSAGGAPPAREGTPGGGRGLVGLDERVRLAGGSFTHGPRAAGFVVTARLPHEPRRPSPPRPDPAAVASVLPPEHRKARRRARYTLAAAVAVPVLALTCLTTVLVVWGSLILSEAVLDPDDYAKLRVGQNRREVAGLLPGRQLPYRPKGAASKKPGVKCEYYAVTADRFVDNSGDSYQLCFRDGRLIGLDVLRG